MKKLMRVETNASTMFVTYDDEEKIVRVLDNEETNPITDEEKVKLEDVEDEKKQIRTTMFNREQGCYTGEKIILEENETFGAEIDTYIKFKQK